MKKVYIFLFILLAILRCKAPTPQGDYDYILSQDSDIIFPPSGTAQQWVTIIGGNHTGKYYVAPDGSDTNPGTAAAPLQLMPVMPQSHRVLTANINPDRRVVALTSAVMKGKC